MHSDSRGQTSTDFPLGVLLIAIAIGAAAFAWAGGVTGGASSQSVGQAGEQVCDEAFGEEWKYSAWLSSHPPAVQCDGPNGLTGTTEMPPWMQRQVGVVTDETYRNMTEGA